MLPLFYHLFLPSNKKTGKKHGKNKEKFACRDPGRHPSRKDNRAEALWIPKTAWRLLCNLYISGSKRLPTECERAHNQDSLFTWRTASALSSFLAFSPILLAFSLSFLFPLSRDASLGWNLQCASSVASPAGHVISSDDSPRPVPRLFAPEKRGHIKDRFGRAVYLLR